MNNESVDSLFTGANLKRIGVYALLGVTVYLLFFWRLDGAYLWRDEAATACWAREMVESGSVVPRVWDGEQLIVQGAKGHDFTKDYLPAMQGWLQFYVAALSFGLFGVSTFTARLLFALLGVIGIYLFYRIFRRLFSDRHAILFALSFALLSVPYIHFARQSRYYALVLVLSLAIIYELLPVFRNAGEPPGRWKFVRLGIYGLLLFFSNYFTFGLFWLGLLAGLFLMRDRAFTRGMLLTSLAIGVIAAPVLLTVHEPFIQRVEITRFFYLVDYWDWLKLNHLRINRLFPIIPFFLGGIYVLWRYPEQSREERNIVLWIWLMIAVTAVASVVINKSNSFIRYYLYVIPLAILLIVIYAQWVRRIFGIKPAVLFLLVALVYHSWPGFFRHSEAVVQRQFTTDASFNKPMVDFLAENVQEDESVTFIKNDIGMVAYFYLPELKWYGLLEAENPYNQIHKRRLPPTMFDDYRDIDWVVVWGEQGLPQRVEMGHELMWSYEYGLGKREMKAGKNIFTPKQYTITQAEAGMAGELEYYDFYRRISGEEVFFY